MKRKSSIITSTSDTLSLPVLKHTYSTVDSIIDMISPEAMQELMSGNESDLTNVLDILVEETAEVIAGNSLFDPFAFGYLEKFSESVEETLRRKSLNYFILSCLPNFILGWHNIEWGNLVQMYRLLNILAARDHGKSYQFSFAYVLWQMYRYKPLVSGKRSVTDIELSMAKEGLLITNEYNLAKHLLGLVKEEIENNDILRERILPESTASGWGAEMLVGRNGAKVTAKSSSSKTRGYHPTWMILDDFLNESSLYSQEQRDKYWNTFVGVLIPALSPGGQMVVVGTPFFEKDLYGTLKEKKSTGFKVFEYPAIYPDGSLLFPERHTFDSLMEKRELLGSLVFSREILVKPISDQATIFPYSILELSTVGQEKVRVISNIDNIRTQFIKIAVGCDFALSSSIGADYSVFTIGGLDEFGKIHVLNCWRKQGANYAEQIKALKMINRDFRPDVFIAETNGMQEIFKQMMEDAGLPVIGSNTGNEKKSLYKGVPAMAALFETKRIKFPYGDEKSKNMTDLYHSELNSITFIQDKGKLESTTQHDDTSMSLWQMVKGLTSNIDNFDFSFVAGGK